MPYTLQNESFHRARVTIILSSPNESLLNIAIVADGIAELCHAVGLLEQSKNKVSIYESVHHLREIGAGVFIHPSVVRAMN